MRPAVPTAVRGLLLLAALGVSPAAGAATAPPKDPDLTFAARETFESWRDVSGGVGVGDTTLNKLQISGTWTANAWSNPGFRLHAQVFRTNGERLTSRVGDLQTVSNIEALSTDRLFEAWAEQSFGKPAPFTEPEGGQ